MTETELYSLRKLKELKRGDVVFIMMSRAEVTADPYKPDDGMTGDYMRLPLRFMDGRGAAQMAPPFTEGQLIPVRVFYSELTGTMYG